MDVFKLVPKMDEKKVVTLICDCYRNMGFMHIVKQCTWTLENDEKCPKVKDEDYKDWECDPRLTTCDAYPVKEPEYSKVFRISAMLSSRSDIRQTGILPHLEPGVWPFAEPVAEPVAVPVSEPVEMSVSEPVEVPVLKPVEVPISEPFPTIWEQSTSVEPLPTVSKPVIPTTLPVRRIDRFDTLTSSTTSTPSTTVEGNSPQPYFQYGTGNLPPGIINVFNIRPVMKNIIGYDDYDNEENFVDTKDYTVDNVDVDAIMDELEEMKKRIRKAKRLERRFTAELLRDRDNLLAKRNYQII